MPRILVSARTVGTPAPGDFVTKASLAGGRFFPEIARVMRTKGWSFLWLLGVLAAAFCAAAAPRVEHVVIISMDGAAPWVIRDTSMPTLQQLAREGAVSWEAETIRPSVTLPSHTSMLTGVTPGRHKITWNDWRPTNGVVRVPTIFAAAKKAGLSTAMFVGKIKFHHLLQPGTVDHFDFAGNASSHEAACEEDNAYSDRDRKNRARAVAARAADYLRRRQPNLCFVHLADPDVIGHQYGWGSPEQRRSLQEVDAALGTILKGLRQAGLRSRTVVLVTADHGGHEKGHSKGTPADVQIPWLAWGRDVRSGTQLNIPINTCDTAATALWLLDVTPLEPLDGRPVKAAFR
jgi:predicted AlkP superfamily pyrophosphatase or phosphodiesterase